MTTPVFPDIDEARSWYTDTKNGLLELHKLAKSNNFSYNSDILYMSHGELDLYYKNQKDKHEIFAALAIFAACEGGIRRDLEWRTRKNMRVKMKHHHRFCKIKNGSHVSIVKIIENWIVAEKHLKPSLNKLLKLFKERNHLAHGSYAQNVAFEHLYREMKSIKVEWRKAVNDFHGY